MTHIVLEIPDEQQIPAIIQLLDREKISYRVEATDLVASADLYAELYDQDVEGKEWIESVVTDWH